MAYRILAYATTFLLINIVPWQVGLVWATTRRKSPPPAVEEELMIEAWHLLKNEEEGGLLPSLFFLWP